MEIVSGIALISINATLILQVLSFLIFLFIINRLMFRPLRKTMGERAQYIAGLDLEISDAHRDVMRYSSELDRQTGLAVSEANEAARELEKAGIEEAQSIVSEAVREIADLKEKTQKEIELKLADAERHLGKESEALSIHIMEKILERRLSG
jgi:F-type H+-transporting ATPase subunit b